MEIKFGNYISRIWFLHHTQAQMDGLANLWRKLPNGNWKFDFMTRLHMIQTTIPEDVTEDQAIRQISHAICRLSNEILPEWQKTCTPFEVDMIILETDNPQIIIDKMSKNKNFHIKGTSNIEA